MIIYAVNAFEVSIICGGHELSDLSWSHYAVMTVSFVIVIKGHSIRGRLVRGRSRAPVTVGTEACAGNSTALGLSLPA